MKDLIIIGAGASGLIAAISAAATDPCLQVTVLEALDKPGKKILATGNGRCNLTNRDISPAHYHTSDPKLLAPLLAQMPAQLVLDLFDTFHMPTDTEDMGRVYPHSRQASTVRDTLLRAVRRFGGRINILTEHKAETLTRNRGRWRILCGNGASIEGEGVILSAGGAAAPKQGTDGSGLSLAQALGHEIAPIYPCLTAFRSGSPLCKGLKGVRGHGRLKLEINGKILAVEDGEIQFTDYGISGIPAFQLSCRLKPDCGKAVLTADLLPGYSEDAVREMLDIYRYYPNDPIIDALPGVTHPKLMQAALKELNIPMLRPAREVSLAQCRALARVLKGMVFPVTGVQSWDQAQVTGGGVRLTEIDEHFRSRRARKLWLCGEMLDVTGDCGGYNLHWAWCSGMVAGQSAGECQ